METSLSPLTLIGIEAALHAGELLRRGFGTHFSISHKPHGMQNLVTEYDRLSEKSIIHYLRHHAPSSKFLGEEGGESGDPSAQTLWIIDPLDGTVNFAHGLPHFSVSIAALQKDRLFCGVIYHPITRELFVAERKKGAFCNGTRLSVSKVCELESAFLVSGLPYHIHENPLNCIERTGNVMKKGCQIRFLGSAALDLAYTAAGHTEGFLEVSLAPWDVAAGILLLEEAGGQVTHWDLKPFDLFAHESILATNGLIHKALSQVLCS
jgi:myo-inositol-1(or 4)-monophosphatase